VDLSGNVYAAEYGSSKIRKVLPDGTVSTFTSSTFASAYCVSVDLSGNVYCTANYTLFKITPTAVVTTLAGGAQGYVDGPGTSARFIEGNSPTVVDSTGNIYMRDFTCIRKITPTGVVSTLAGNLTSDNVDGTGTNARFLYDGFTRGGIAVDLQGTVYVSSGGFIRKITPSGVVTTLMGKSSTGRPVFGSGTNATFGRIEQLAAHSSGVIYLADSYNNNIYKIA
jgi:hypothetical protein